MQAVTADTNAMPQGGFRPDVEGLRAIAVTMVLLYHVDISWATGGFAGVDVFFVISGFLITGLLAREVERSGTISLVGFYARRAKRLFPAAAIVLLATAGMTVATLPRTRWAEIGGDVFASAAYFINWRLAGRSVDYLAEDSTPSPVQHFWSLAVEEQYYIAWPILLLLALLVARRFLPQRAVLWIVTIAIAVPSLAYSVHLTNTESGPAYFITATRMWELAIGAGIALAADSFRRMPASVAASIGWLGLASILSTVFLVSTSTPWPGSAALLPTLGTAAVIASGFNAGRVGPVAVLGTKPMCWIGAISYSLYLWHWPLVLATKAAFGMERLAAPAALTVVAVSIALAWLTLKLVENPIRFSKVFAANPRYALSNGLNFSLIGAVGGLLLVAATTVGDLDRRSAGAGNEPALGAAALRDNPGNDPAGAPRDQVNWFVPDATQAVRDVPDAYRDGCQLSVNESEPKPCIYGKPDAPLTVAVVGDSKVIQWLPALEILAEKHDWRLIVHGKSSCGFHSRMLSIDGKPYSTCYEWNRKVLDRLKGPDKADFLITSHGRGGKRPNESETTALLDWWVPLSETGTRVIAIANNPNPPFNVYECVAQNPGKLTTCAFPRQEASGTPSLRVAASRLPTASFVDLNDAICPTRQCAPIIGNVLIYRQGSHLTRTYVESLAPRLERELERAGLVK